MPVQSLRARPPVWFAVPALLIAFAAAAQNYPDKAIRVYTTGVGGSSDLSTRIIAQAMGGAFAQRMIVENRALVSVETVAGATPDGYSLLHYSNVLWLMPLLQTNVPWDTFRDFAPVVLTVNTPNVLVVHPSLPVKTVKALIAFARARPGELNYASTSLGAGNHVAAELFNNMAGVKIVRINYKSMGAGFTDVVAGQIQVMFPSANSATQYVKSARLRALAVTSAEPSALVPDLPTVAAAGLPGYESVAMTAMFAPAKTPDAIVRRLNQEINATLKKPEVRERFLTQGTEAIGGTPEQLTAVIKTEIARLSRIIRNAGLQ
jgi:tripartite-type tricarboxylate transporter receptor subunit TctC